MGLNFGEAFEKFGHCAVLGSRRSRVTRRSITGGGATSTPCLRTTGGAYRILSAT